MTTEERIARLAEQAAAEVRDGMTIGLGSGSTAEAVVRALGHRVCHGLQFAGVATSARTRDLALSSGITIRELDDVDGMDLGIDGADEIDPDLNLVKGRGGALLWEKLVARECEHWLIVSTSEKLVDQLGTRMPLPVEVIPYGWTATARRVEALGCTPVLRTIDGGAPFVTDGGHYLIDCKTGPIHDPFSFAIALKEITGVVDHGLFIGMATRALTINESGEISEHTAPAGT